MISKGIEYPDWGFSDELNFNIRNEKNSNNENLSIWNMIGSYVQGKNKFQRLNNLIDDFTADKEQLVARNIMNINNKIQKRMSTHIKLQKL